MLQEFRLTPILVLAAALAAWTMPADDSDLVQQQLPSYPLTTCVVSGEALGETPVDIIADGRLVRFCCNDCVKDFKADPEPFLMKIEAAVIEQQLPGYPLDKCVVSGEPLPDTGTVDDVYGTRLVRFCCVRCVGTFKGSADKYMAAIDTALIATQKAHYPLTTCVVSGEPLGDAPKDLLYGTHLVRFCCNGCIKDFKADPAPFLAKLAAAAPAPAADHEGDHGHADGHDGHAEGEGHHDGHEGGGHDDGGHDGR